jgi:hypothetical protein
MLPVIRHNLLDGSPPAQDFFEEEGTEGASGLGSESVELQPCGEQTSDLNDVLKSTCVEHENVGVPWQRITLQISPRSENLEVFENF